MSNKYKPIIKELERGQCVSFNGTLKSLGIDLKTRNFEVVTL